MSFCGKCGKELPEGVTVCDCENIPSAEIVETESSVEMSVEASEPVAPETTFVVPIVNGASVGGDVSVTPQDDDGDSDVEYLEELKDCKIINILALLLLAGGIVSLLLINEWMAAVMFLVGEIFVLVPNTRVEKICKEKNPVAGMKAQQTAVKETIKRLKSKDKNFNFSCIIAIVCLVSIFASFIVPSPLVSANNNSTDDTDSGSNNYEDVAVNSNDYEEDTSDESDEKVEATSFITRSNFEMYEEIKPYCKEIGYDVDSWVVDTNTKDCLVLFGPEHSTQSQMVMVTDYMFIVQMKKNFFVSGKGNEGFFIVTGRGSEEEYIFGFIDVLLADCPEELKYTGQYLRDNYNDNVYHGTATFEKAGIQYQVTYLPNTNGWHITVGLAEG